MTYNVLSGTLNNQLTNQPTKPYHWQAFSIQMVWCYTGSMCRSDSPCMVYTACRGDRKCGKVV